MLLPLVLLTAVCDGRLQATPSDIPGLKIWLDADAIPAIAEGAEVPLWPDVSGNALNGILTGSVSSGTYISNAIDGHAAVRFSHAANAKFFEVPWGATDADDITVFAVARPNPYAWPTTGSLFKPIVSSGDPAYGEGLFCIYAVRGGVLQADSAAAGVAGRGVQNDDALTSGGNGTFDNGRFHVLAMRMAGSLPTNKFTECWFDGSAGESWQQTLANPANDNVLVGAAPGTGRNFHGDIAEVIIYDRALDEAERESVEDYLLRKYRIGGTLLACWTFEDPSPGSGMDSSGYNAHGLPVHGPLVVDDSAADPARDSVLKLAGGANNSWSDHVDLSAYALALTYASNATVAAWFKTTSADAGVILGASDRSDASSEARLFCEGGYLRFDVREEGSDPTGEVGQIISTNTVNDGAWHHAALSVNTTNGAFLYVDGVLHTAGVEPSIGAVSDLDQVAIGRNKDSTRGGGQWFYDGLLDNVAISARVYTETEARALYSLEQHDGTALQYNPAEAETLLELHGTADGEIGIDIRGMTWWYWDGGISGALGEVHDFGGGRYALRLNAHGSGVATVPQQEGSLLMVR